MYDLCMFPRPMSENARGGSATDEERRVFLGRTRRERTRGRPAARPLSDVFAPRAPLASGLTWKSGKGLPTNCAMLFAALCFCLLYIKTELRRNTRCARLERTSLVAQVHEASLAHLRSTSAVAAAPYGHKYANAQASLACFVTH